MVVEIIGNKNLGPKLRLATLHEITGLLLEHCVVVGDGDQFIVTESFCVCDISKVRIPLLTELFDDK